MSRAPMIRILHVYRTYFPDTQGGLQEVIRTLAGGLARDRFEVMVFCPSREVRRVEEIEVDGVLVCRVPELFEIASCNVFLRGLGAFRRWARWADIVHYHFPWPFADILHLLVAGRPRPKVVITYHSDIVRQRLLGRVYAPLMRRFLRSADRIVATSEPYLRGSALLAEFAPRVSVIPIGIDAGRIPRAEPQRLAAWRARVGEGFFFFVGVLRYYKGLEVLLRAVAGTRLRVVIAGDGPEGVRLRALAERLGAENVRFTGRIPDADKWALFALCRAMVFPSNLRSEAYGVALLEAMACARPVISVDIGSGMNFVNIPGETGLWAAPDDPAALREAMLELENDDELCARLGHGARERVATTLSARRMVEAYQRLYCGLCDEGAA
jgi:rhamnosyl/mannosyltransferase